MRKIRKHITTIILAVLAVIAGVYAYNYHDMKQNIVYNEHLEDVAVNVNGKELTLRDMAFYVAYEEMNVEKQALVYDSDNPNKYWNIHTNGEFVRVAARKAAMSMAIHDEIFYEMAKKESITLTDDEKAALKNSATCSAYSRHSSRLPDLQIIYPTSPDGNVTGPLHLIIFTGFSPITCLLIDLSFRRCSYHVDRSPLFGSCIPCLPFHIKKDENLLNIHTLSGLE